MKTKLFALIGCAGILAACGAKGNPESGGGGGTTPSTAQPAAPTNLKLHSSTETSLTFQWDAMKDAAGYSYTLAQGGTQLQEGNTNNRNVSLSGLSKATTYTFTVCSVAGSYKSSGTSIEAKTAGTADPVPTEPSVKYADFLIPAAEEALGALAFPGAEGGGMYTTGGRGGKVYHVTKLTDDGSEGTLRYGIEKESRPLIIVFDVAGIIPLSKALKVEKGDVTLAGQTAPGDGICLKNYNFRIAASNVIVRFMRFRMGDEQKTEDDAMNLYTGDNNIKDVMIDHCSLSWSTDECGTFYGMTNFSLQWSILSESLLNSVHDKGKHGYGGIWGGANATYHHNLLAHHYSRNPRIDHDFVSTLKGPVSLVNNVIYNWGDNSCYGGESKSGSDFKKYNIVGNYYKPGPATPSGKIRFLDPTVKCDKCESAHPEQVVPGHFYMTGNVMDGNEAYTADNWSDKATTASASLISTIKAESAFVYSGKETSLSLHSAEAAFDAVLDYAGASLKRDSVDERIARETEEGVFTFGGSNGGAKGLIDTQGDVGGWPSYNGTKLTDTDGDGIPDAVEDAWGLNKNVAADGSALTLDEKKRYTNLEMYLHYLVRDVVAEQNQNGTYTKQL